MLMLILVLSIAGAYIESRIVNAIPLFGILLDRHRNIALVWSILLSAALGALFGAAGVIIFASGILSTVILQPWYALRRRGLTARFARDFRDRGHRAGRWYVENEDLLRRRVAQILLVLRVLLILVSLPVRAGAWVADETETAYRLSARLLSRRDTAANSQNGLR